MRVYVSFKTNYLMLFFLMASCKINSSSKPLLKSDVPVSVVKNMELGHGFNSNVMNSTMRTCVDFDSKKNHIDSENVGSITRFMSNQSSTNILHTFGVKVDLGIGLPVGSFSDVLDISNTHSSNVAENTSTFLWMGQQGIESITSPRLTKKAQAYLNQGLDKFLEECGDEFVEKIDRRAWILATMKMSFMNSEDKKKVDNTLSASYMKSKMEQQVSQDEEGSSSLKILDAPKNNLSAEINSTLGTLDSETRNRISIEYKIDVRGSTNSGVDSIEQETCLLNKDDCAGKVLSMAKVAKKLATELDKKLTEGKNYPHFLYITRRYQDVPEIRDQIANITTESDLSIRYNKMPFSILRSRMKSLQDNYNSNVVARNISEVITGHKNSGTVFDNLARIETMKEQVINCLSLKDTECKGAHSSNQKNQYIANLESKSQSVIDSTIAPDIKLPNFEKAGAVGTGEQLWLDRCLKRHGAVGIALRVKYPQYNSIFWKSFVFESGQEVFTGKIDTNKDGWFSYRCIMKKDKDQLKGKGGPKYYPPGRTFYSRFKVKNGKSLAGNISNPIRIDIGRGTQQSFLGIGGPLYKIFLAHTGGGEYGGPGTP